MRDFISLLATNVVVTWRTLIEQIYATSYYLRSPTFFKVDCLLFAAYLFHNPFKISKNFLMKRGEKTVYAYGETPLSTLEIICQEAGVNPETRFFELGCGRGKGCFWLNLLKKCEVVGIDFVPAFIERASAIQQKCELSSLRFFCEDIANASIDDGAIVYLYGTGFEENLLVKLAKRLSKLAPKTTIITVSYPLSDYVGPKPFVIKKIFPARFFWGEANVYIQEVRKLNP